MTDTAGGRDVSKRWKCNDCDWIGDIGQLLKAPNPFAPGYGISGCPECKCVEDFTEVCDEPGCDKNAGCGFPTPDGYRRTCYEHSNFRKEGGT